MSGGWTVVDSASNKSIPIQGLSAAAGTAPYITPAPSTLDPVGKFRVSQPQALIDTDFEYGTQPTKWETICLQNNRQSCYYIVQSPINGITSITGDASASTRVMTIAGTFQQGIIATPIPSGTPIYIQNASDPNANGWWWVVTGSATSVTVITSAAVSASNNYNPALTYVYLGYFYSNAGIQLSSTSAFTNVTTTITCTTANAHGLTKDSFIYVKDTASSAGGAINGAWVVATVPTANTFTFVVPTAPTGTLTNTANTTTLFARPAGYVEPRSFDGGVAFSAGAAVPNQQLIRQSRRYFRYQSGKGIQFSTGSSLKPALFVTSITNTASSTNITVTTRYQHNIAVGARVQVVGCNEGAYNGTFTIVTVPTPTTFTYTSLTTPPGTVATGFGIRVSPVSWYGSANRVGLYDSQNGMFFEYDGQTLSAVLRNSINQLDGTVSVTTGNATVTGTTTRFTSQLAPGDFIVIRGQSYRVVTISNDTDIRITPEYRGSSIAGAIVSKTIEVRIPQSRWADKCDGTGPSGYNVDLSRMQMFYIDYSWYGAGVVRFGFRATNGVVTYVTQIQNNNIQFEAYMRSGNLPSRYESVGIAPMTFITSNVTTTTTTNSAAIAVADVTIALTDASTFNNTGVVKITNELIYYASKSGNNLVGCIRGFGGTTASNYAASTTVSPSSIDVADPSKFPPAGTIKVQGSGSTANIEYIAYTGNDGSLFYGLTRAQTGGAAAAQSFTFSATAPVSVELASPDTVPSLSHWGSSVIMDGNFNDDKSLIFNYGTNTQLQLLTSQTQVTPILAIRIAPSADNGQTGLFGTKEIVNRMQLQLFELGVVTSGPVLITLILNGYVAGGTWTNWATPVSLGSLAYTSSLAQVAYNTLNSGTLLGGESIAAAYTNTNGQTTLDLNQVRDIGNSILGGGTSAAVTTGFANQYPDGPDIIYVCATNVVSAATPTVLARLSWKEAQA
jgi:hypothetical protein